MGGGFYAIYQDQISSGPSIIATPLLVRPLWQGFVAMPWWSKRWPHIVLENLPMSHVSNRKYPCMSLVIISSMIFSSLSSLVSPCTFYFITWHARWQVSPDLSCTLEWNCVRWSADGVLPSWSSPSILGKSPLNRNDMIHGAGWECRFPLEGGRRRGRHQSPKGAMGIIKICIPRNLSRCGFRLSKPPDKFNKSL